MLEELTQEEEIDLFLKSYKGRGNLFEKGLMDLFLKSYKEKYNLAEEELKKSFLELYKEKHSLSEAGLKESFLKLYPEKYYLSEKELLEFRDYCDKKVERIVVSAAEYDLLPVIKYFIENGGNPYFFVIKNYDEVSNILNVAATKGSLDIINYLLDNNIFTVDQRATENSQTPFYSAVEWNNIETAKFLLERGAEVNAKFNHIGSRETTALTYIFALNNRVEMAKLCLKH
ncbi:ankyrin repeat domain-containing protein [Rickettsia asembonensis]|uniref:ankyrin repeat domain-containing protein n=1 Tax=Rickettsia asembonensis TaxID=1068590 RepID=UPI000827141D|nr:ankyrin repeat domain-containing protein [Rickettsia asembonensis]